MSVQPILPSPDFIFCNSYYGTNLVSSDCLAAAAALPDRADEVPYYLWGSALTEAFVLPFTVSHGESLMLHIGNTL